MKIRLFCSALITAVLTASSVSAQLPKIQTFETAPQYVENDFNDDRTNEPGPPLEPGRYSTREESNRTTSHRMTFHNAPSHPTWNNGGWIEPLGTETAFNNRGPIGGANYEGIPTSAVLTNLFTGINIHDEETWGDVSNATFVTLDVKGSFAGSGGISLLVSGEEGGTVWSWTAAVSDVAVGANPGDVTEWTTLLIPINKPTLQGSGHIFPSPDGTEGHIDGPLEEGGNWGVNGDHADDAAMIEAWDLIMSNVHRIGIHGITPDTQIDNLGFIFPDVGLAGDFDLDEDVDGADFLLWQRDMSVGNLADWEANFGTVAAVGAAAAVPEPSAIALALFAGCALLGMRRKCEP